MGDIGIFEKYAIFGQAVEVWSVDVFVTVAGEFLTVVFGDDEEDVGAISSVKRNGSADGGDDDFEFHEKII